MSKLYEFSLDIKRQSPSVDVGELVMGDKDSNVLKIKLLDGKAIYALTDKQVSVVFHKSDDTTVMQSTDDEDAPITVSPTHEILCVMKTNSFSAYGQLDGEVVMRDATTVLTSQPFTFWVREPLGGDDTIASTNEFPILLQVLRDEADRKEAEAARVRAEELRDEAERARELAEGLRDEAERGREELRATLEDIFLDMTIDEGSPFEDDEVEGDEIEA